MDFLNEIKLVFFLLEKYGDESLLNDFESFTDFAEKRFGMINLDGYDIPLVAKVFYALELNLDKLKSKTLDENNIVIPDDTNYSVTYYETYNELIRYTYKTEISAPNPELAKKIFGYYVDEGYIDNNRPINREHLDTEFADEGLISVYESSDDKVIKESTRKIVKELFQRKLNK